LLVTKEALNGDTIFEEETYVEMIAEHTADPKDDPYPEDKDDSDDDIPF
jgi:hypothetical protein